MARPDRELIDVNEGARISGLEKQTLYRLKREGRLRSFTVLGRSLRFDRRDVLALVKKHQPAATRRANSSRGNGI